MKFTETPLAGAWVVELEEIGDVEPAAPRRVMERGLSVLLQRVGVGHVKNRSPRGIARDRRRQRFIGRSARC